MPDGSRPDLAPSAALLTLPNAITFARLCAVPAAVYLVMHEDFLAGFWLFLGAGISDAIDGWLARRQGPTYVGALLDPVADKALLVAMYVMLSMVRVLPDWLAILVVFRDALIVGGVLVLALLGQPATIAPLRISKLNTLMQIVLVAAALLLAGLERRADVLLDVLIWLVTATTLASGAAYIVRAVRRT
jgi:cardiolipin synthase (CMP-forming)